MSDAETDRTAGESKLFAITMHMPDNPQAPPTTILTHDLEWARDELASEWHMEPAEAEALIGGDETQVELAGGEIVTVKLVEVAGPVDVDTFFPDGELPAFPETGDPSPAAGVPDVAEEMTVAELFGVLAVSDTDSGDYNIDDAFRALGGLHPASAGMLVAKIRRAIDSNDVSRFGTASGSEHPDWHASLEHAKSQSDEEGYDV
ncbi:hypothetical protein [Halosegnis longus]|uniref:hypothetical protein n=1 Tax=Halosegnis longus TaxID=2216012 RepID=UPI00129DA911|nr:hypothetical protein [Halosegnis longus]